MTAPKAAPKTPSKQVYKSPKAGQPLLSTVCSGLKTPILEIKFSNLFNPYRYPNSPTIPRYSVTCLVDPQLDKEFIVGIQSIERDEKVASVIKNDATKEKNEYVNTGKVLVKFQSKDKVPVYRAGEFPKGQVPLIELEDELAPGERIVVVYDIIRYTKKNTMEVEHGLSFKPTCIYLYAEEGK